MKKKEQFVIIKITNCFCLERSKNERIVNICNSGGGRLKLLSNGFGKYRAFTLAEVLITIGIIGVVAAMTMPSLINDAKRKQDTAKLKKFYSTMSQAVLLAENEYGSAADWSVNSAIRDEDGVIIDSQTDAVLEFFNKYFAPHMEIISSGKTAAGAAQVVLADGSFIYLSNGNCIDIVFDTNGYKKPNKSGYDRFHFLFCNGNYNELHIDKNKYFGTYSQRLTARGKDYIKEQCKSDAKFCSTLLLYDGWEFKKDYPYRL